MIKTDTVVHSGNINSSTSEQCGNDFSARRRPWCYSYASKGICTTDNCHCKAVRGSHKEMVKKDNLDESIPKNQNTDLSWLPRSTQTVEELARKSSAPRKCRLKNEPTRENHETTYKHNQSISRQTNLSSEEAIPRDTCIESTCHQTKRSARNTIHLNRHDSSSHNTLIEDYNWSEIASDVTAESTNSYKPTECCVQKHDAHCHSRQATRDTSKIETISRDANVENHAKLKTSSSVSSFSDLTNDTAYKTLRRAKWTLDGERHLYDSNSTSSFSQHYLEERSRNTVFDKNKAAGYDCCNNHFCKVTKKAIEHDSKNNCRHSIASYENRPSLASMAYNGNSSNFDISYKNNDNSRITTPNDQCSSIKFTQNSSTSRPSNGNISVSSTASKSTNDNFKCDLVFKYLSLDTKDAYLDLRSNTIKSEEIPVFSRISSGSNMTSVSDRFESDQISKFNNLIYENDNLTSGLSLIKTDLGITPKNIPSQHYNDVSRDNLVSSKMFPVSSSYSLTSGNNNLLSKLSEVSRTKLTSLMNALKERQRAKIVTHEYMYDRTPPPDRSDAVTCCAPHDWSDAVARCEDVILQDTQSSSQLKEETMRKNNSVQLHEDLGTNKEEQSMKYVTVIPDVRIPNQSNDQELHNEHLRKEIRNGSCVEKLNTIDINDKVTSSLDDISKDAISSQNFSRAANNELLSELQQLSARLNNLQYLSAAHEAVKNETNKNSFAKNSSIMKLENIAHDLPPIVQHCSSVNNVLLNENRTNSFLADSSSKLPNNSSKLPNTEDICDNNKLISCLRTNESTSHGLNKDVLIGPSQVFKEDPSLDCSTVVTDKRTNGNDFIFQRKSNNVINFQVNLSLDTHKASEDTSYNVEETPLITQYRQTILDSKWFEHNDCLKTELNFANDQNVVNSCDNFIEKSSTTSMQDCSPSSYFPAAQVVKNDQLRQIRTDEECHNLKPFCPTTDIISILEDDKVSDSSVAKHFMRTTYGADYNDRILQSGTKKRLQTKRIRNKLLHNHCPSPPMSDVSDDITTINRKFTSCSFTSKKKRKRSSPIGQLLKSYLHQASSSDVEIDGLELSPFLKVF